MERKLKKLKYRFALLVFLIGAQLAHIVASVVMIAAIFNAHPRGRRVAIGYDQLGNVATGGSEDETISSRAGRGTREGRVIWCLLCKMLDWIEENHCEDSLGQ